MAAARARASELMPYLSTALFAVTPIQSDLVPTLAVDRRWRLYWNPAWCHRQQVEELAGGWLHEVAHVLRQHADRFEALLEPSSQAMVFNIASDAAINQDLRAGSVSLPAGAIELADVPGGQAGMTAEQFYWLLAKGSEPSPAENSSTEGDLEDEDGSKDEDEPGRDLLGRNEDKSGSGGNDRDENGDENADDGDEGGSDGRGGDEGKDGDEAGDDGDDGDGNDGAGDDGAGDDGDGGIGRGEGEGDGNGLGGDAGTGGQGGPASDHAQGSGEGTATHARLTSDCGSGVTPGQRPWELPDEDENNGIDADRGAMIRRQVAEEIREFERDLGRGLLPAGMLRWANEILHPRVDWRAELKTLLRREIAAVAGRRDYTYSRPARRSSTSPDVVLPAMRQPRPPLVSVLIDTSASMSVAMLEQCLGEIDEIIVRVGSGGGRPTVTVVACDAEAGVLQSVRAAREISLVGGGGTDLAPGIEDLAAQRPRPDLIVVLTDGDTPWAEGPPAGNTFSRYIAVLVDGPRLALPSWLKPVVIDESPYGSG
jgi:predicted metal-dependent peptidase